MPRYNSIAELPDWARPTIRKLCDRGAILGKSGAKDAEGYPTDKDLSEDMTRMLVWSDREGLYGE